VDRGRGPRGWIERRAGWGRGEPKGALMCRFSDKGPVWIHRLELVLASLSSTSHKVSKYEGYIELVCI
jgi:hypothetical protein